MYVNSVHIVNCVSVSVVTTRRERQRSETIDEIKAAALQALAEQGTAGLSVRGIARAIDMSPAGLYRYYDGIDALITDLVTDAYDDLADAVVAAMSGPPSTRERLIAGMLAYREWSVAHPHRFMLVFGTPIPGYSAPEDGPTVAAVRRIGEAFFGAMAESWSRSEMAMPAMSRPPTTAERDFATALGSGFPPEAVPVGLSTWAHFHGLVTLEVVGQLQWMYPDPGEFYRSEVERIADRVIDGNAPGPR